MENRQDCFQSEKGASASSKCNGQVYLEYVNVTLLVLTKLCLAKKSEHYQPWSHFTISISFGDFIGFCNGSQEFNYQSGLFFTEGAGKKGTA